MNYLALTKLVLATFKKVACATRSKVKKFAIDFEDEEFNKDYEEGFLDQYIKNVNLWDPTTYYTAATADWKHLLKINETKAKQGELPSVGTYGTARGMAKLAQTMASRGMYQGK